MKIEKLKLSDLTYNDVGLSSESSQIIFDKLEEIIDQLEKQGQLNKTFSERLGLDPDDDRLNEEKCACGEETTFGGADVEIGGVCHRVNKPCFFIEKPDKLKRLLEWVERYSVYRNKRWLCPDNIMIKDLTAKIKSLINED